MLTPWATAAARRACRASDRGPGISVTSLRCLGNGAEASIWVTVFSLPLSADARSDIYLRTSCSTAAVELRFLYIGSDDTERDLAAWLALPGARLRWRFEAFGADVAAVDLGPAPRPPGRPPTGRHGAAHLRRGRPGEPRPGPGGRGLDRSPPVPWARPKVRPLSWPTASGTAVALLRVDRPGAMDDAYADEANEHARRAPRGAASLVAGGDDEDGHRRSGAGACGAPSRGWRPRWAAPRSRPPR